MECEGGNPFVAFNTPVSKAAEKLVLVEKKSICLANQIKLLYHNKKAKFKCYYQDSI